MKIKTRFYAGGFPLEVPLGTRGVYRMLKHGNLYERSEKGLIGL